jgi:hypothetical protein
MDTMDVVFVEANLTLEIKLDGNVVYEIDLERCDRSATILDTVFQLYNKQWATPELASKLLKAFDTASREIHGKGIQGIYCPFGHDKQVPWKKTV